MRKPYLETYQDAKDVGIKYILNIPDCFLVKTKNKIWLMWWLLRLGWMAVKDKS